MDVYIGLGANVGDRLAALRQAVRAMASWPETEVFAASPVYETEAHVLPGAAPQPDHLNAVVHLQTALAPEALLARMQDAERAAGRDPAAPAWSPRALDLDLILYGDQEIHREGLTIPHPRLVARRFVLAPLADLAPDRLVPGRGRSVADVLRGTLDASRIEQTDLVLWNQPGGWAMTDGRQPNVRR